MLLAVAEHTVSASQKVEQLVKLIRKAPHSPRWAEDHPRSSSTVRHVRSSPPHRQSRHLRRPLSRFLRWARRDRLVSAAWLSRLSIAIPASLQGTRPLHGADLSAKSLLQSITHPHQASYPVSSQVLESSTLLPPLPLRPPAHPLRRSLLLLPPGSLRVRQAGRASSCLYRAQSSGASPVREWSRTIERDVRAVWGRALLASG